MYIMLLQINLYEPQREKYTLRMFCQINLSVPDPSHYEIMPIQIYSKFHLQKLKKFR